jgi:hypothetical protein
MSKGPDDEEEHDVVGETYENGETTVWYDEDGNQHADVNGG